MTPQSSPSRATTASETHEAGTDGTAALPDGDRHVMTRTVPFAWLVLVTSVVGWLASGELVLEKIEKLINPSHTTICDVNPWVSCGEVMSTWQSSLFGFPNMFIGIVAFAVTITVAMALLAGARFSRWFWVGLQVGVTLGFVFVIWLWSQALYAIGILCPLCMIVWAMMIPLFVWTTARNVAHGVIPAPARVAKALADWGWVTVAVLYVAVIATIFFRFLNLFVPSTM
ncbi:Vitamin K epoxide reductase family protein [Sinomonas atrocyanea]|uniref:Vitamin K epoxide reductase family protein n=2 Tax=Sinomonas atrocyanea TaxID=37927 RepID=A0A127A0M5_9MICC|nr:vitamin K epoxide reductase family protein [Sinomonas atrocyanea]AMM32998.1 Vitamin K epoxide reductase family protein [Sinomonas atrocyanea]GEB64314.1 membrane protein [Sinomonas atrocyanea]GGG82441.1 membrane protein [Sinomonas atrocyanea]